MDPHSIERSKWRRVKCAFKCMDFGGASTCGSQVNERVIVAVDDSTCLLRDW
jgi:predicted metal-binding protein